MPTASAPPTITSTRGRAPVGDERVRQRGYASSSRSSSALVVVGIGAAAAQREPEAQQQRDHRHPDRDPHVPLRRPRERHRERARRWLHPPAVRVPVDQRRAADVRAVDASPPSPALLLSPSTNQNGVPLRAPVTCSSILVLPLLVTFTFGVAAGAAATCVTSSSAACRAVRAPSRRRSASEPSTSPSTSMSGRRARRRPHDVVAAIEREVLFRHLGVAAEEVDRLARLGVGGRSRSTVIADVASPSTWTRSLRHSAGNRRRHRRALHAGHAHLGERHRHHLRLAIGVAQRLDRPHLGDRDLHVAAGERGERHRHRDRRVADLAVGDRGKVDGAGLPAGLDLQLRRHRVLAVGDDLQVEMVERHRLRASPRRPTAPAATRWRCSTRSRDHRRTPTSRGRRCRPEGAATT